jgi:hypothetical protein
VKGGISMPKGKRFIVAPVFENIKFRKFRIINGVSKLDEWEMEQIDQDELLKQLIDQLSSLKGDEFKPLENMLGLVAEYAFDGLLDEKLGKGKYDWNVRRADYFEENSDRPYWDFILKNGLTFEIGAARPYHNYAVMGKLPHKCKSDYFVQVQLTKFQAWGKVPWKGRELYILFDAGDRNSVPHEITKKEFDDRETQKGKNVLGVAIIKGFDKISDIKACKSQWKLGEKGEFPTTDYAGWYKPLDKLKPFHELVDLITSKQSHF